MHALQKLLGSLWTICWQPLAAFFARPQVSVFMMRLATRIDPPLMRVSRGRLRLSFVIPVLLLHSIGARTGQVRTLPLLYVPVLARVNESVSSAPDALLLIASNAGQDRHPAWYFNLRAQPNVSCSIAGQKRNYHARLLGGEERQRAFAAATQIYPGYQRYAQRCERQIGVFQLDAVASD